MPPTKDDIDAALSRIEDGESPEAVARSSALKRSTVYKYMKMKAITGAISIGKRGPKSVMPLDVEQDVVTWIAAMQRSGWPVDRFEVLLKAGLILSHRHGVPRTVGPGWYARFRKRHPELSDRVAQKLSHARNAVTREGITKFFFDLVKGCLAFSCTSADIYNVDETSFKTKGSTKKVIAVRGSQNVWRGDQNESYHLTIVAAVAADGTPVPPAFILPGGSCATNVLENCPVPDAMVSATPKAFMTGDLFDSWLECFGEWKLHHRMARPAVLVLDNCSSHLTENSLPICEAYGICIVLLPPNSTHLLQPLDVALFRSFKKKIAQGVTRRLQALNETSLPRAAAIQVAGIAFNEVFPAVVGMKKNTAAENGFSTCGIWPLSLPKMLRRLAVAKANCVKDGVGTAAWLKTKEHAREEVLLLPPKKTGKKPRKRVVTQLDWFTRDALHASAVRPVKRKK